MHSFFYLCLSLVRLQHLLSMHYCLYRFSTLHPPHIQTQILLTAPLCLLFSKRVWTLRHRFFYSFFFRFYETTHNRRARTLQLFPVLSIPWYHIIHIHIHTHSQLCVSYSCTYPRLWSIAQLFPTLPSVVLGHRFAFLLFSLLRDR